MIGLLVLGGAAAYIAIFWFVIAKARNRGERISAIVVSLLIPFFELPFGIINFYRHCSLEAGIHRYEDLRSIDAVLIDGSAGYRPEELLKLGFKTVEYRNRGEIVRVAFDSNKLSKSVHPTPISAHLYESSYNKKLPWNIYRNDQSVTRLSDRKVVARRTDFSWGGLWWEAFTGMRVVSPIQCSNVPQRSLLASLKITN